MSPHTPGPWRIWKRSDGDFITNERGDEGVCRLMQRPRKPHEELPELVAANARLIVAAPELLMTLRLIRLAPLQHGDEAMTEILRMADAAIAKAEGRS
jgi:hypothetical protein